MDAILHIGIGKTGTSSIQKALFSNQALLSEQGFHYPESPVAGWGGRHIKLSAYGLADDLFPHPRKVMQLSPETLNRFREELRTDLADELKGLPPGVRTVVFSDEGLSSFSTEAEIARIRDLLAPHFSAIRVIVYLRRQDRHSVSHYTQHLKAGRKPNAILRKKKFYRYDELLDLWAGVFGEDAIKPRIFERERFSNGDATADFLEACGIARPTGFELAGSLNESLSAEAEVFLGRMNDQLKKFENGQINLGRNLVIRHLLDAHAGTGHKPARAEAQAFLDRYADANERVRARWFPDQDALFSRDVSDYPEAGEGPTVDDAALFEVAQSVVLRLSREYDDVKEENYRLLVKLVDAGLMDLEESGLLLDQYVRLKGKEDG